MLHFCIKLNTWKYFMFLSQNTCILKSAEGEIFQEVYSPINWTLILEGGMWKSSMCCFLYEFVFLFTTNNWLLSNCGHGIVHFKRQASLFFLFCCTPCREMELEEKTSGRWVGKEKISKILGQQQHILPQSWHSFLLKEEVFLGGNSVNPKKGFSRALQG